LFYRFQKCCITVRVFLSHHHIILRIINRLLDRLNKLYVNIRVQCVEKLECANKRVCRRGDGEQHTSQNVIERKIKRRRPALVTPVWLSRWSNIEPVKRKLEEVPRQNWQMTTNILRWQSGRATWIIFYNFCTRQRLTRKTSV